MSEYMVQPKRYTWAIVLGIIGFIALLITMFILIRNSGSFDSFSEDTHDRLPTLPAHIDPACLDPATDGVTVMGEEYGRGSLMLWAHPEVPPDVASDVLWPLGFTEFFEYPREQEIMNITFIPQGFILPTAEEKNPDNNVLLDAEEQKLRKDPRIKELFQGFYVFKDSPAPYRSQRVIEARLSSFIPRSWAEGFAKDNGYTLLEFDDYTLKRRLLVSVQPGEERAWICYFKTHKSDIISGASLNYIGRAAGGSL